MDNCGTCFYGITIYGGIGKIDSMKFKGSKMGKGAMLMHIAPIEVLKWGTEFLFFLVIPNTIQFEKGMKLPPQFIGPFIIKETIR